MLLGVTEARSRVGSDPGDARDCSTTPQAFQKFQAAQGELSRVRCRA